MAKQPTTEKILEWKARRGRSSFSGEILSKVEELARAWEKIDPDEGFADFVPVRLCTIIEVYVRETVREVVDSSPTYLDRAEPLLKNAKFDFLLAKQLHGRRVTMGDIVAHSISVSDLEHIISGYETLLPGYRSALPTVHERWIEDRDQGPSDPILDDVEHVLACIKRLFQVRHIVTHEMPSSAPYSTEDIPDFLASAGKFLSATDWFLTGELRGDVPQTQASMNILAGEELNSETVAMERLLVEIRQRGEADIDLLKASQDAWADYAEADANLRASLVGGGSMQPVVWAIQMTELTRTRIAGLQWWLEREEGSI
ncbi:DUF1311 domain-containing protein [Methylocystis sp. FS]|uniref:lysozyme inhibitor LprI family protein n=1 Tax=Methylocystis silviterrae TaxID=2743612 RepID=UPI001583783D|nr:lysozyme inhibitor LprI family protein [Methylocystis silviterrae]NUJ79930.1 DUF1311 domain-containing protein [Methylocystis silviterrae]